MSGTTSPRLFVNRAQAGEELASAAAALYNDSKVVVYGIARGGVIAAAQVAQMLRTPLIPICVQKIGHPIHPEYAIGSIGENGAATYNMDEVRNLHEEWLQTAAEKARHENTNRQHLYQTRTPAVAINNETVAIIVDDGIATGLSIETALQKVRALKPAELIVAIPVAPLDAIKRLSPIVDKIIILENPLDYLGSVGSHYLDFDPITDERVAASLETVNQRWLKSVVQPVKAI